MIIDNLKRIDSNPETVFEFFQEYITVDGRFDMVTGYFTIKALAKLYSELQKQTKYRLIIGDLTAEKPQYDKIVNLLNPDFSIQSVFNINQYAAQAVSFLQQSFVEVRTVKNKLCHAKAYIHHSKSKKANENFFLLGSSNLTDTGLRITKRNIYSNIELNHARFGNDADFKEIEYWYSKIWMGETTEIIPDENGVEITCKDFLINRINNFFKKYTPLQLYYKILYELFKDEFSLIRNDDRFLENIRHLRDTKVYQKLFIFQEKGVLSLIRMLQLYGGAILADAVGLGKTWQALAVIKYFELQGYETVVFCPKKLRDNWVKYHYTKDSLFREDKLRYSVRHHTDFQINPDGTHRLDTSYSNDMFQLSAFQNNAKILVVIDESHNLRNDKSERYNYLIDNILKRNKDVKVLLLSATPINNHLTDIRNQFKLLVGGNDSGFRETKFAINSLESLFTVAQREFNSWQNIENRRISQLISSLPQDFFELTDELVVARTRKLVEGQMQKTIDGKMVKLHFPKKSKPQNLYIRTKNIGKLKSLEDILKLMEVNLTAYKPTHYTEGKEVPISVLHDEKAREGFLVKMMYILMVKRLESSWFSFKSTVENILAHHINALTKIKQAKKDSTDTLDSVLADIEKEIENLGEEGEEIKIAQYYIDNSKKLHEPTGKTLGKKNPIHLSQITKKALFIAHLDADILSLTQLITNLNLYDKGIKTETSDTESKDEKLEQLMKIIKTKQNTDNQKIVIFSTFADTVTYIYNELKKRGFTRIAYITGQEFKCDYEIEPKQGFEPILERFAPFTKLYNEKSWDSFYETNKLEIPKNYKEWLKLIEKHHQTTYRKISEPVDILIATDCLSEGQNLQDADMVVNYDVHWNPVRLIQRFGRIDRIGSPNKTVQGINFWSAKDIDDYLNLKNRVEDRLALMTVVGAEINDVTPELKAKIKNNPLVSKQTEKMLRQMQTTWDDVETNDKQLGMNNLSLEEYRQDLFEFLQDRESELQAIPNGVFSGFHVIDELRNEYQSGILALIGFPRKAENAGKDFKYQHLNVIFAPTKGEKYILNNVDALRFLKTNRNNPRFVPENIETGDKNEFEIFAKAIKMWMDKKVGREGTQDVLALFDGGSTDKFAKKSQKGKLDELYYSENWDLIVWLAVSENL